MASAAARPQATIGGTDAYPDLWSKAAALLQSAAARPRPRRRQQATRLAGTAVFLELNGVPVRGVSNHAVYEFVMWATTNGGGIGDIAEQLHTLITS